MPGRFITFEGTEGAGKSTQIKLLAERIQATGHKARVLREPGGTPIGEEIRHTLQHSAQNAAMTPEAELLLINASRAQLVREVIRPALAAGEIVLCDRFYHSTLAYQGYGRQLDLKRVQEVIDFAVGDTRPDLTLMLHVPLAISEQQIISGRDLLAAFTVGVEIACRIGNLLTAHFRDGADFWHITNTCGVLGSAAAAGRLLGLTEQQMIWTFAVAGTQACGVREVFGSDCKPFHAGKAAQNGLVSALLVQRGFTGTDNIFSGPRGFMGAMAKDYDLGDVTDGLGVSRQRDDPKPDRLALRNDEGA